MDWRDQLHASLKATEANLARLQGAQGSGYTHHYPTGHHAAGVPHAAHRPQPFAQGAGMTGGGSVGSPAAASLTALYHEQNESIIALRASVRGLGSEMDLERQAREDAVREVSRRTLNEAAELREMIRQLREDNQDLRRGLQLLERRPLLNRGGQGGTGGVEYGQGDGFDGGNASVAHQHIAILPRVADLEQMVQQLQSQLHERKIRTEEIVRDAVRAFGEDEIQKMRTVARDAARESTDEYIRVRTDALHQTFSVHLDTARQMHEKSATAVQTIEQRVNLANSEHAATIRRLEERVECALEAKEKWVHMTAEVQDLVRSQLDSERARIEETLRILRAEVATATKRQTQESVDSHHAMQHFVNQRLEGLQTTFMLRDEVAKMLQANLNQLEQGLTAARTYWNAAKTQFDEGRAETLRQMHSNDGKWSELRAAVDDLVLQKQADAQVYQRLRSTVDEMQQRVKQAHDAAEQTSLKLLDEHQHVEQLKFTWSERDREAKATMDGLGESWKKYSLDQSNATARLQASVQRLEQQAATSIADVSSLQQLVESLSQMSKESYAQLRKQLNSTSTELDETLSRKCGALIAESIADSAGEMRKSLVDIQKLTKADMTSTIEQWHRRVTSELDESKQHLRNEILETFQSTVGTSMEQQWKRSVLESQRTAIQKAAATSQEELETRLAAFRDQILQDDVATRIREVGQKCRDETTKQLSSFAAEEDGKRQQAVERAVAPLAKLAVQRCETSDQRITEAFTSLQLQVERALEQIRTAAVASCNSVAEAASSHSRQLHVIGTAAAAEQPSTHSPEATVVAVTSAMETRLKQVEADLVDRFETIARRSAVSSSGADVSQSITAALSLAKIQWQQEVEQRWDTSVQNLRRQLQESNQIAVENMASLRRLIHEVDERASQKGPPMAMVSNRNATSATDESAVPVGIPSRLTVRDMIEEKRVQWIDPIVAHLEGLQNKLETLQNTVDLLSAPPAAAPSSEQPRDLGEAVALETVIEEKIVAFLNSDDAAVFGEASSLWSRVESMFQALDQQTLVSLEALDGKINALAETFSNHEELAQLKAREHNKAAKQVLREMDSFFNNTTSTTTTASTTMIHDQTGSHTSAGESEAAESSDHDVVLSLAVRVSQCVEALQTISLSAMDTVDLLQRHEQGFASIHELVQAILFNAANIVTLAEAVGLDKDAFALKLNYPEYAQHVVELTTDADPFQSGDQ